MDTTHYRREVIGDVHEERNTSGGITVNIEERFQSSIADFHNAENVTVVAHNAVRSADGIYYLIKNNCPSTNPAETEHFEIYLWLASLACEIYMKAVIYFETIDCPNQIRGHKLSELFSLLPEHIKSTLEEKVCDLRHRLPTCDNYFTKFRYDFELNAFEADLLPFPLMDELKSIAYNYRSSPPAEIRMSNGTVVIG